LQIYHDGSNSHIVDTGTGSLLIKGDAVHLGTTGGEYYLRSFEDGAVSLRYDNSTKFETNSAGVKVTGQIEADEVYLRDSEKILLGTGTDLQIYHDGSSSRIYNSTGDLVLRSASYYLNSADGSENIIKGLENGAVELYYDNSKKFETTSQGAQVNGLLQVKGSQADSQYASNTYNQYITV
jgi:hypothetical protein